MSKVEDKFASLLRKNKISYVREKTYPDLKNGKLRFDFYIPTMNILLEIDSELHFQEIKRFHKDYGTFHHAQENDRIKNAYALAHGIRLYRIPYWEFNNITSIAELFSPRFIVTSRWHNDIVYRKYQQELQNEHFKRD